MYQVEVIAQEGEEQRMSKRWRGALADLAGPVPVGNVDLTHRRPDPNFFTLFETEASAEAFRTAVFESGLSKAVYVVDLRSRKYLLRS